jgi:hypothetical protein
VFDSGRGGVIFSTATGSDVDAIAQVQAQVRQRLLCLFVRRGLLPDDDAADGVMGAWRRVFGRPLGAHRGRWPLRA